MGKITKTMQSKHQETQSPWLKSYVETASTTELPSLPQYLASFPSRWPFGRGDLYHWIPLLNRFDDILEHFNKTYHLKDGPQQRDFALDVLKNMDEESPFSNERQWDDHQLAELGFSNDGDIVLIEAVLRFSRMLLEHCGNRSIYASSAHLNDLLNSTSSSILIHTLEAGSELAQRYQASVKRIATPSRQISSALLANHYNIDLDRVLQLAMPFVKTPIVNLADSTPSATPLSTKGKDKVYGSNGRNLTTTHANDLVAIATCDNTRWQSWGDIKVLYYSQDDSDRNDAPNEPGRSSEPSTPTPLRRSHTIGSQQNTPRVRMMNPDDSSPILPRTPAIADEQTTPGQRLFELPKSVIGSTSIYDLIRRIPEDMPQSAKYEVFHRLRVAKSLADSIEARQQMLATRLLAITNLAYIHSDSSFVEKVLRHDVDETRRYQLVYQLAELIHPAADPNASIPLRLQTFALALLEAIAGFTPKCQDVLSALNANVNHGILLYVIRKAVAGMQVDDAADLGDHATEEDDWRNNLFSLTLHLSMSTRVGSEMVSAGLMSILVEILNIRSHVAQRHHSMVLAFLDGLIWTYQNAFTSFFNANGLDAVATLLVDTVAEAQGSQQSSHDVHADQQSATVDYEIPYHQQQTLKWLLKFVHHIMSNAYSYGGNTDRLLRNLAEKSDLLQSLREIIANKRSFGSVVWTNSVTILSDFINNDPTSFAAISESGMIKTYLEAITGRTLPEQQAGEEAKQTEEHQEGDNDGESSISSATVSVVADDDQPHPPSDEDIRRTRQNEPAKGILASSEAMNIVPQVLNSICLNNTGMKMVVASKAFDSFLEIFESPVHVNCMETNRDIASNVGANFDELARHHPPLRTAISDAVIDMVARVRWLGIEKGINSDWGVRLYVVTQEGVISTIHPNGYVAEGTTEVATDYKDKGTDTVDIDMSDEIGETGETAKEEKMAQKVVPSQSLTPYIHSLANFLTGYLSNTFLKTNFVKRGGIELLLDLCESPSLDAAFGDSAASRVLNQVVTQLIEHSPVWGLPSLLRRAQNNIDTLQPLAAKTEALPPYFGALLSSDLLVEGDNLELHECVSTATQKVKALLNAQTFIKILSDCFTTTRSNSLQFYHVNVYDYYLRLVKSIGPLLRGVLAEEAGELLAVPQHWSMHRQGAPGVAASTDNRDGAREGQPTIPDVLGGTSNTWTADDGTDASAPVLPTEQERSSARYTNYETLRTLLHPMIPTCFPFFQALGKALLPRREPHQLDPFPRPRQLEIAMALASSVLSHLAPSVTTPSPTSKDFHYWIIMLHTIHEMLIDHPSTRQSDRSSVQIIMPVLLAFKEQGGMSVLSDMIKVFASSVRGAADTGPDESSRAKVAAFGLKKVLDLYHVLVNGKYLSEACSQFSLQRQADRTQNVSTVSHQIVVEFRAAILPVTMELWNSSFIEKVSDSTVKRLLDIIKIVCGADHEVNATLTDDKVLFNLFKYKDARFKWARFRPMASEFAWGGWEDELVHEAMYRANGTLDEVAEYCRAHVNGLAGPRNPIPAEDADLSALKEDASDEVEESGSADVAAAAATAALETEPMNLDTLRDLPSADDLIEYVDRQISNSLADDNNNNNNSFGGTNSAAEAMSIVQNEPPEENLEADVAFLKERLDSLRWNIRTNLIDQCLDVIRTHPDTAMDVSDLVSAIVLKKQNQDAQEDVASTLTFALSSLALDEEEKRRNGKCIAAYAHLLALLLQDEKFFAQNTKILADKVDEYVGFLKVPLTSSIDELPPWIPYILLVLEVLLCHDERPVPAEWKPPQTIDDDVAEPVITIGSPLVGDANRSKILVSLLDLLPRIGKEEMLATAVLRVLVILTRRRTLAKVIGEKKNLQRLFLMAKQLSGTGSEGLKQMRLSAHMITILRHVIEDEETVKQIMRAQIQKDLPPLARNQRGHHADVSSYLRAMAPLALRAPDLFVEVTNEMLCFSRWLGGSGETSNRPSPLAFKDHVVSKAKETAVDASALIDGALKASTEPADKEMTDAPKTHHDVKRPIVENPDGVIHFLLCELVNYREVDDKEPSTTVASADTESSATVPTDAEDAITKDPSTANNAKDKKQSKPVFKAEEHPIFVYRCFLLNCLTELLQSYTRTKVEFINFKRSAPPLSTTTPIKPRTSILNYLIYDLLCQGSLNGTTDTIMSKKRAATSALTQKVLVALVSKTSEKHLDRALDKFAYDDEPDLLFVRKFVLDTVIKAYEKAPFTDEPFETRYSRMQCLAELMNHMIGDKDRDTSNPRNLDFDQSRSQAQMRRLMYEKGFVEKLTSSIAEISLDYPGVKRAIKYILRVLRVLTGTVKELSHSSILPADPTGDNSDEEFASSSSVSDVDDDNREETPDLYRNSALGMLEPRAEDDESDEGDEDDDQDMYGDDYEDDELDYGEDDLSDGEDDISDEDEELSGMGDIEGLHGEPGVVEVIMDDDDDDEGEDEDDDSEDDEDDGMDSADMEDVEDRVEIVDEDGDSGWESESDMDEDEAGEDDDLEYDAEAQDEEEEAIIHSMGPTNLLTDMARAIIADEGGYEPEPALDDHFLHDDHDGDEDDDDEEEINDDEYIYDDGFPGHIQPSLPGLGWENDDLDVEEANRQLIFFDGNHRRPVLTRMDNRSPYPSRFATSQGDLDFRSYFARSHRPGGPQSNAEDGLNPLLRRSDQLNEASLRPGNTHSLDVRLPAGLLSSGRHNIDGPMGLLGELMEFLPMMGRNGNGQPAFHFHITGPGGPRDVRDLGPTRLLRTDNRRDVAAQEPSQAVSFVPESTLRRYQEEARMVFGNNHHVEAAKLGNIIAARLTPDVLERERKIKAQDLELQKQAEEERKKKDEEERKTREEKVAEETASKEKREAEQREENDRAQREQLAAAESTDAAEHHERTDQEPMEGVVETSASTDMSDAPAPQVPEASAVDQPRVMTTIRGEEVDVTELGIDPEYLAALPEEFREEVIAQTVSERRSQAREEATAGESTDVFQEFLDALPEELRLEIAQQERQEERRRHREEGRRQAAGTSGQPVVAEMDAASILLTFPPALREQVLMDQGEDIMDQLTPEMAAQARALNQQHPPPSHSQHPGMRSMVVPGRNPAQTDGGNPTDNKVQRRTVVQMLDKPGIATLVRLMFIAHHGSIRSYLFSVFADICENRQNRLEVISTILQILQEGSTDMNAVERSFGHLSIRARKHKERETEQKTPQGLRKSLTNSGPMGMLTNSETSPLLIVQQCLDLLVDLCTRSQQIPWLFLTEHEAVGSFLKKTLNRKGKAKDLKAHKYAINSLLTLLDREVVTESSIVMTHLADLLNRITLPLVNLDRKRKDLQTATDQDKPTSVAAEGEAEVPNAAEQASGNVPADATIEHAQEPAENPADGESAKEKKEASSKKTRQLQPPVIPAQNLTLVVKIFVARECSSKTFQNTISTIKNLSAIPGAKAVFGQELVYQARLLSENIVSDLDELLPHIERATTGTEIQGVALSKFSPGASEQNKLLRILTALDHLFDGRKKDGEGDGDESRQSDKQHLVTSLYHNSTFSAMWEKLSACLKAIRERESMLNVATILLPLIESLMVVCKNTTAGDDFSHGQINKELVISSPAPESRTASLFFTFTEDHRRILNELVRNNPKLMSGTFALLVKNPKVLEFDNKRNYFNRSVHSRVSQNGRPSHPPLQLSVRRDHVFHDSFRSLYFKSGDEMKFGKLNIRFHGEEGVDAGGVTREWFQVLSRQMFDPNYVLFTPVSSDRTTFHPTKLSGVNPEHLLFFKFIGRIIGKALYEGRLLDCFFSRAVYKRILGKSVSVKDMESFDPDYYKSLCWMLENEIADIITETFSVEDDEFGVTNIVDLIPNGREVAVTDENKHEYVRLVVEHRLLSSVKDQMESFLKGFHEIIPAELISIFSEQELELLISGLPDIDVDDWKSHTEYQNYTPSSQQIQWFWRAVRSFDKEERAKLLQFVTGTSKVPLNGFKELEGMNGVSRFNIHRDYGDKDRLPSSHTCFNQLDIPEYESYDTLRAQLYKAITQGSEYFGFA